MRFLLPALLLFAFALPGGADPAAKTAAPPKKLTLAQALATAPPADGLLLSVSAEQVTLPDDAEPPPADASTSDIAAAFGDQNFRFGAVTAIAPPTMTVLNTQPDAPNIAADLNSSTALKMLTASLDDTQWQALTSERGLGLSDLSDDIQRGLFHALFPQGRLLISSEDPALNDVAPEKRTDVQDVSAQIDATRIRLGQTARFYLHDTQGKTIYFSAARPDVAQRLHIFHPKTPPSPVEHGVALSAAVPNALKSSDLDYDSRVLQVPVSPAGAATVGDLVTRIGQKTKLEMYADPHYAARTLTVQGPARTEPAADLLRALCVCVTGTFRKVGPAYVLTDDLAGVGTRRKHLGDWEDEADHARDVLRDQAGSLLLHRRGATARTLPALGDPLAVSPQEMAAIHDDPSLPGVPEGFDNPLPFATLTPAQQSWLRQTATEFNDSRSNSPGEEKPAADLTRNVDLKVHYALQMLVPSQSQPVDAFNSPLEILYIPSEEEMMANEVPELVREQAKAQAKLPPAPPLSAALHLGRFRDVLAHPRSAKDVDALVAVMQKLGLNTLLLDVFSGGVNHVKTSATLGTDILAEALARTRGTGTAVYADLSLLAWGDAPPDAVQDLTVDGLNTRSAAIQDHEINPSPDFNYETGKPIPFAAPLVQVSPVSPQVQTTLTALVQDLAARPGLAGVAWDDVDSDREVGFAPEMRLAFLRSAHADPLDLTQQYTLRADDTLPLFDDPAVEESLHDLWVKAKLSANTDLLRRLRLAAIRRDGSPLPVLVEEELVFNQHNYLSWNTPVQEQPPLREQFGDGFYVDWDKSLLLARTQNRSVLHREVIENDGETSTLAQTLSGDIKALPPNGGFVLDFRHDEVTQGAAPLASLVLAVSDEAAARQKATK